MRSTFDLWFPTLWLCGQAHFRTQEWAVESNSSRSCISRSLVLLSHWLASAVRLWPYGAIHDCLAHGGKSALRHQGGGVKTPSPGCRDDRVCHWVQVRQMRKRFPGLGICRVLHHRHSEKSLFPISAEMCSNPHLCSQIGNRCPPVPAKDQS